MTKQKFTIDERLAAVKKIYRSRRALRTDRKRKRILTLRMASERSVSTSPCSGCEKKP